MMAQIPDHFHAVRQALHGYIAPVDEPNPWDALRSIEEQLETARREREQTRDLYADAIRQRDEWKERCHALTDAALEQRRFGWQESQTMTALLDSELSHAGAETSLPSRDPN